jgi:hypothetical protein
MGSSLAIRSTRSYKFATPVHEAACQKSAHKERPCEKKSASTAHREFALEIPPDGVLGGKYSNE